MFRKLLIIAFTIGLGHSADLKHGRQSEPVKADMNDVHFLLWTRSNSGDSESYELLINDVDNLAASPFDASRPTVIMSHGWNANGHSGWPVEGKTELLTFGDYNAIAVDWGKIAGNIDYFSVFNDLPTVGQHVADFVDFLHDEAGLDITALHAVGHSLGAHLSGFMGAGVKNGPVGRITGLDPAGPEFYQEPESGRLDASDAVFVEAIHSNAGPMLDFCVGLKIPLGQVDYFPNGGDHQPGCTIGGDWMELLTAGCSHGRSHEYWVESINGAKPFTAVPCSDWETFQAGGCTDCGAGCPEMGFHASTDLSGIYMLETRALKPYAKG